MKVGLALLTCREIRLRKIERLTAYTFWSCLSLCHFVTQYLIKGLLVPVEFHQRFSALTSHLHIWLPSRGPALVLYPAECNQCSSPLVFYCLFFSMCVAGCKCTRINNRAVKDANVECVRFFFQPLSGVLNRFASAGYFGTHCFD